MLYEIHIRRWIVAKRDRLEKVIDEIESEIFSNTEIIKAEKLNKISLNWQKYRIEFPDLRVDGAQMERLEI